MLQVEQIEVRYGEIVAVKEVNLHINRGETVALLGANGAGKSTTLKTISGLLRCTKGKITYEGKPIGGLKPQTIARMGIVHVPEGRRIFPGLSVADNLLLGISNRIKTSRKQIQRDLEYVLSLFPDLLDKLKVQGWSLSGGQQQMLAIARGLMAKPNLLLLDEPSLGLAPLLVQQVFRIIQDINRQGITVLLVEQNAKMALQIASRGYVLESGRTVLEGEADELLTHEGIRTAYLGGR
ncbi:ABC transporter ATP-binding protein [Effusibacillus dendaii]|uniref:ABC transporter ATP-binding protein n=1 Tax=Effusibacillus dendaii TaxID=2743772 RepID=A0A7I8D5W9_9BACL|nr:ABC transporter ATP-binding protein [Effusibacillus dendaii]BCJ85485.1 ABC transporter ATP-binding protein [Effusibacillus dendaii]